MTSIDPRGASGAYNGRVVRSAPETPLDPHVAYTAALRAVLDRLEALERSQAELTAMARKLDPLVPKGRHLRPLPGWLLR